MSMVRPAYEWNDRVLECINDPASALFPSWIEPEDVEEGMVVTRVSVIAVSPEWCHTEEWWIDADVDMSDVPTHIARVMTISNTGWNVPLTLTDDSIAEWGEPSGNAPGYQGCYEYTGGYDQTTHQPIGEMCNDSEALQWVDDLLEDAMAPADEDGRIMV